MKLHLPSLLRRSLLALLAVGTAVPSLAATTTSSPARPYFCFSHTPVYNSKGNVTSYIENPPTHNQNGGDFKITLGEDQPWLMAATMLGQISFSNMNDIAILNACQTCEHKTQVSKAKKYPTNSTASACYNEANVTVNTAKSFTYSGAFALNSTGAFLTSGAAVFNNVNKILFSGNTGGTLASDGSFRIIGSTDSVIIENNVVDYMFVDDAVDITNCKSVVFRNNHGCFQTVSGLNMSAGTYSSWTSFTCSGTEYVEFSGNDTNCYSGLDMDLMMFDDHSLLTFSDIDTLVFRNNTAGNALILGSCLKDDGNSIKNCNTVIFADNTTGEGVLVGDVEISGVKNMTFSGNTTTGNNVIGCVLTTNQTYKVGGDYTRHVSDSITISGCGNILFENNSIRAQKFAAGAALEGVYVADAEKMVFRGNSSVASAADSNVYGGAVYINVEGAKLGQTTKEMLFENNTARGGKAYGGAAFVSSQQFNTLEKEWRISMAADNMAFIGNTAVGNTVAAGGAIGAYYAIDLEGSKNLIFRGNSVHGSEMQNAKGGAIAMIQDTQLQHSFTIRGNDYVEFRGNYETDGNTYRLNSFFSQDSANFVLAAEKGKTIAVYDAFEINQKIVFNGDPSQKDDYDYSTSTGTILLSGKYAEEDLAKLKPNYTQEELDNSRESMCGSCLIERGTLEIRDKAALVAIGPYYILFGTPISMASLNNPSFRSVGANVLLQDGTLGGDVMITKDMEFYGSNNIVVGSQMLSGLGTWKFHVSEENKETALVTIDCRANSTIQLDSLTFAVDYDSASLLKGKYKLLSCHEVSGTKYVIDNITCTGTRSKTTSGSDMYFIAETDKETGEHYNTLIFDYSYGPSSIATRAATTLTWSGASGVWKEKNEGCWTGSVKDLKFYNKDSVVFNSTATVSVESIVRPASVKVGNSSGTVTFNGNGGQLTGDTSLVKTGAGALTINMANAYSGGTTISAGTVTAGHAAAFGIGGITLSGGTLAMGTQAVANAVTATGGTLTGTAYKGALTVKGNVTLGSGFKVGSLTLASGTLTGTVKTGDVHTLNADGGRISGALTLNGGSIVFGGSPLSVSGALTISSSTALDFSAYSGAGQYTLISAGSVSGNLTYLNYDTTVGRNSYRVVMGSNSLVLNVTTNAATLAWNTPRGVWSNDGSFGNDVFRNGDLVQFGTQSNVTIKGPVNPGSVLVNADRNVVFTADRYTPGSGITGSATLTKEGAGMLTLNAGNTYSGGTILKQGTLKAAADTAFGTGVITVKGGTLDLGSKAVTNDIVLAGNALLKGDAKYTGALSVQGQATLLGKMANKSTLTIGSGNTLTLAPTATVAGQLKVDGGTLNITSPKGLTLGRDAELSLPSGTVNGTVIIGMGGLLSQRNGSLSATPVLAGGSFSCLTEPQVITPGWMRSVGSVYFSGTGTLELTSTYGAIQKQTVAVKSRGQISTNKSVTITSGKLTLLNLSNKYGIDVQGGSLSLSRTAPSISLSVTGSAAINTGTQFRSNVDVTGELLKGTVIKLTESDQRVDLGGAGVMNGTISGLGIVNVNANIDASLGKMTNAAVNLNSGTLTNIKGMKLVKGQTLTFGGGNLNLSGKLLTTAVGSTLNVTKSGTLDGNLTMAGGTLVLKNGATLTVNGALTLTKPTELVVNGTTTIKCNQFNGPRKGTLEEFFGVDKGITITQKGNTLTFSGYTAVACAAPEEEEPETVAAYVPVTDAAVALAAEAAAARPLGDALVMADWAIVDANRAFTNTLQSRRDSGVMLADGQGMAWVSAMGGVARHGSENGHNGADVNMSGAAVGVEHTAGKNSTLGLAVGHTWSRIGATGMQHLRQDTAHVALYGTTKLPHGFTAEWSAAYGDTDSKGSFYGTRETWSQKSTALSARLNKTHDLNDATAVRGFAGLTYDATDAASIHGMHTGSIQRLQGEVGAGITHRADKLTTYAEASVTTDLARNAPAVDFGAWRQNGATPGRTGLNLTLGAAYELTDKWSINAAYHVEAAERATQHTLNIGAGRKF